MKLESTSWRKTENIHKYVETKQHSLKQQMCQGKNTKEIRKYLYTNGNENTTHQN